jgi:hypothetical protein
VLARRHKSVFRQKLAACLALGALLLVLSASYWHAPHGPNAAHAGHSSHVHHDHDHDAPQDHPEHSCPVCVAVHTPTSNGLTGAAAGVPAPMLVGRTQVAHERAAPALPLPVSRARGPPPKA